MRHFLIRWRDNVTNNNNAVLPVPTHRRINRGVRAGVPASNLIEISNVNRPINSKAEGCSAEGERASNTGVTCSIFKWGILGGQAPLKRMTLEIRNGAEKFIRLALIFNTSLSDDITTFSF